MIPQLATALAGGYSTKQIMQFLIRQFPHHANKIKQAMAAGFTVDQIVKFLGGGRKGVNQESEGLTEHEQTRSKDIQRRENVNNQAMNIAKTAALAGGGALAAPMARSALQRAAPQLLGPGAVTSTTAPAMPGGIPTQTTPQLPPNLPQSQTLGTNPPSQPPVAGNIPQQPQAVQPQVNTINIGEIINKHGLGKHIDELAKNTQDPKAIAGILYSKFPKEMKKFQVEAGKPMEEAIADYMQTNVKPLDIEEKAQEPATQIPEQTEKQTEIESTPREETSKIEAGQTVASPQGIGEVKAIRNGKAIIEVDGKKHQIDEDELIQSPIPEKDLADLFDDLISGIEKTTGKEISKNVDWAGYDPNTNELAYKPHGGDKLYVYEEISPEDVNLLTSVLTQRKSTGENFIGPWIAGTDSPIGAAMSKLIKKLQAERGGKGNEYKNKYETIYDALEPAKKAAKERHAERKKKAKKPRLD